MCSYKILVALIFSCACTSSIEVDRILGDGNIFNSQGIEDKNPSGFRLTKLLDIRLNGKSDMLESNLEKLIGSDNTNNIVVSDKLSQIEGSTNENIYAEQYRKEVNKKLSDVVKAIRDIHSDVLKIKQYSFNTENDVEKEVTGLKTLVGVQYKPSAILNGKSGIYNNTLPKSCKEVFENGHNVSGLYEIQPKMSKKPFVVLCDMDTRGGGWTTIQKRYDGSQDFYLGWRDYKFGFGDLEGEFWIGLENIYKITVQDGTELLVELEDRDGTRSYAHYKAFKVGSEKEGYPLSVLTGFSGDAGDALVGHLGAKFTTKDFDQDKNPSNCAVLFSGAWWYTSCHTSNLNGKYINLDIPDQYKYQGLHWKGIKPHEYSYAKSRMLVRPS